MIAIYVLLPYIQINGYPAIFFDIEARRFHLFGLTIVPQDLWILFFGISGLGFTLFFVTSLLGRVWCGWTCPYTVFLDHIFRRIERWIEGDGPKRRKRDNAPWTAEKIIRRAIKHFLYILCSALIAHIFIAYFVSLERLYSFAMDGPSAHLVAFSFIVALTGILYFCFAWFREQFCVIMCPYGRIQSALTDDDSIIIGYDEKRGEPRGKKNDPNAADCIDCHRCVNVCPTGIDIRNGLQLECIGCAACIDACDDIMKKIGRPTGLVRYDSLNGLSGKKTNFLRPRIILYIVMGLVGAGILAFTFYKNARPINATVTRMRGNPYYQDENTIRNNYDLKLINKRAIPLDFQIELVDPPAGFTASPGSETLINVPEQKEAKRVVIIAADKSDYTGPDRTHPPHHRPTR